MRIIAFVFTMLLAGTAWAGPVDKLADKLAAGLMDKQAKKLAVLEFPYVSGKASEGPMVIQERLTTALAKVKGVTLIERGQLKKVMAELNLQSTGAIDDATANKLGKLLGADAIVTGTLNDINEKRAEVNGRVVEAETGKILSAYSVQLEKTWKDTGAVTQDPPKNFGSKPLVQVAILLDTSSSMDGLINQARAQIWKIVSELVTAEKGGSAPVIEVALYEYGNNSQPAAGHYIRQVLTLTRDLEKVSSELFKLTTNGGDEYAGAVIKRALSELPWSPKTDVYKAIFIAGNEPFTQGPVPFAEAGALAKAKGVFVNTIYCGSRQQGMAEQWLAGAQAADGDYTNIEQNLQTYTVAAPQDARISELSAKLDNTTVAYGREAKERLATRSSLTLSYAGAGAAGSSAMADRAAFKAAAPAAMAAEEASWDAVSALESGEKKAEDIKADELPAEIRKLSQKERTDFLNKQVSERKKLKAEIQRLSDERKAFIAAEQKKQGGASTLDKVMTDTIRRQAATRGYKFSK